MTKQFRWLLSIVLLVAVSFTRTSKAGFIEDKPDGSTIIHVVVFQLPDPTQTDAQNRAQVAAVNAFKKQFPAIFAERYRAKYEADPKTYGKHNWDKVSVELHDFSGIGLPGTEADLMSIATGTPPDVMEMNFHRSDNYIQGNFIYPLDKKEDGYATAMSEEELADRVPSKIWPIVHRAGPDGQEHLWALSHGHGGAVGTVMLFRKDLFDKKGIPYPTNDWTWNDMINACRKISDPANGINGLVSGGGKFESWFWFNYLWAAGGEVVKQDPVTHEWRCTFDSREAAVALDFWEQLNNERWVDSEGKVRHGYVTKEFYGVDEFNNGHVAMRYTYIDRDLFQNLDPNTTGMVPTPKGPTGVRGAEFNSYLMSLSNQIHDRAVRDASWEFIHYYDSDAAEKIKTRIMVEGGLGQFLNPLLLNRYGYPEIARLAPAGWSGIFDEVLVTGHPEPYCRNAGFVYQIASEPMHVVDDMCMKDQLPADREKRLDLIQAILHDAVQRANEQMFDIIAPKERVKRNHTAIVVLIISSILFGMLMWNTIRAFSPPVAYLDPGTKRKRNRRKGLAVILLLMPALVTVLLWQYLPLVQGSLMAFQDYHLIGPSHWIGLQNFGDLLFDSVWWGSVWNAVRYSGLIMALTFMPPIILAILLQETAHGSVVFRVIFYLPAVLSSLVTVILWRQFYTPTEHGLLNAIVMHIPSVGYLGLGLVMLFTAAVFAKRMWQHGNFVACVVLLVIGVVLLLACLGWAMPILAQPHEHLRDILLHFPRRLFKCYAEPFDWLNDPDTAMLACVVPLVWASVGPGCLIYLAALKGIPDDYYEAADIDGATFIDKIIFVVFPVLRPLILINFIGVFIGSWFGAESNIAAMTAGGADTEVAGLHIFFKAFTNLQFGMATAMAWVLATMLIGLTAYQLRIIGKLEFRTTGSKR